VVKQFLFSNPILTMNAWIDFLAYFQILKKYAIVRTKSVRPSVRPSVADSTPQGIDRSRSFWAQSIAYDPRT
jgi:hypothetical protein